MHRDIHAAIVWIFILMSLTLTACTGMTVTPSTYADQTLLFTPTLTGPVCEACAQETLIVSLTQEKNNADNQAALNAEIVRANAQSTLNSANATLNAAQTQEQNSANFIAAQIAATSEIVRANAQATLNSAGATQIAVQTQSQYNLQATEAVGTQGAVALMTQQNKNDLAAGTQTAIANTIATQTQVAVATSQWYADQTRQRAEQRQGPLAFLWMWCLPLFIILFAAMALWGFWHWLRIQQTNQRILEAPLDKLPAPVAEVPHHHHDELLPYLDVDIVDSAQLTTPDAQVDQWLDEVKDQLLKSDKKDKDDSTDN